MGTALEETQKQIKNLLGKKIIDYTISGGYSVNHLTLILEGGSTISISGDDGYGFASGIEIEIGKAIEKAGING